MVLPRRPGDQERTSKRHLNRFIALLLLITVVILVNKAVQSETPHQQVVKVAHHHWNSNGSEDGCGSFGCPIYPAELTPKVYSHLKASLVRNEHQKYPFATDDMLILTQQGASHKENQDRASIIDPFSIPAESSFSSKPIINGTLVCLFDGHGVQGHIVASHVLHEFPKLLASKLEALEIPASTEVDRKEESAIVKALKDSFIEVDIYGTPNFLLGGTTGSVTLRLGSKLYIANVGDSQTIIYSLPNTTHKVPAIQQDEPIPEVDMTFITHKHKALDPEERTRIENLGGKVHVNPKTNHSVVVVYSVAARETIMLAMSRSIGDWEWKAVGVIAEPAIEVVDLRKIPPHSFLMAASDGVWDVRRKQFYGKQFGECFFPTERIRGGKRAHTLAKGLEVFEKITPKVQTGYRDDMTAVLLAL